MYNATGLGVRHCVLYPIHNAVLNSTVEQNSRVSPHGVWHVYFPLLSIRSCTIIFFRAKISLFMPFILLDEFLSYSYALNYIKLYCICVRLYVTHSILNFIHQILPINKYLKLFYTI